MKPSLRRTVSTILIDKNNLVLQAKNAKFAHRRPILVPQLFCQTISDFKVGLLPKGASEFCSSANSKTGAGRKRKGPSKQAFNS